jgi:hypothetical protein
MAALRQKVLEQHNNAVGRSQYVVAEPFKELSIPILERSTNHFERYVFTRMNLGPKKIPQAIARID